MSNVNKVIILGRLGADPESRSLPNGGTVTNLRVATSERWKDKQTGEKKEATEWHTISVFGNDADFAADYGKKGRVVYVEGQLRTRKWQDKNGNDRYSTEVNVQWPRRTIAFPADDGDRGSNQSTGKNTNQSTGQNANQGAGTDTSDFDDDIPF